MTMRFLTTPATALALVLAVTACSTGDGNTSSATDPFPTPAAAAAAATASDVHDHAAEHGPAPELAEGQRWQTDEPLRAAMGRIHAGVLKNLPAFHTARLPAADANALAASVDSNIEYMFANCKLDPEPDIALHALIARMMVASARLREDPATPDGMPQLVAALNDYQATFDHAGMPPLTHD